MGCSITVSECKELVIKVIERTLGFKPAKNQVTIVKIQTYDNSINWVGFKILSKGSLKEYRYVIDWDERYIVKLDKNDEGINNSYIYFDGKY